MSEKIVKKFQVNQQKYSIDLNATQTIADCAAATAAANVAAAAATTAAGKAPYIDETTGTWWTWDPTAASGAGAYVDSEVAADPQTTKADKSDVDNANLVIAEAIAALRRDIVGLQRLLSENAGDLNVKTIDVEEGSFQLGQKQFALVTSAPTEIPRSTGLMRFNPSNGALYVSKSVTNSTSDWVRVQ